MGEVWEGTHVELGTRVALKVLRKEARESHEMVARFAREAFLLARVQSDHVVRAVDFMRRGRHGPVLVMEMLEGETLADILHHKCLPIAEAVEIAIDVLRGLDALHASHVVHRDVKPANVVLREAADGSRRAVLIDLGVGRLLASPAMAGGDYLISMDAEITPADGVVGTPEYMAPEQVLSCRSANAAADVYAVGAVLYRAVAGAHPFADKHGIDLLHEKLHNPVPRVATGRRDVAAKVFENIVERALAFRPADRFESANDLRMALEQLRVMLRPSALPYELVELRAEDVELVVPPPLPHDRVHMPTRRLAVAGTAAFAACTSAEATVARVKSRPSQASP
jgi:serine/threonine protein kinase